MYPVTVVTSMAYTFGLVMYLANFDSVGCVDSFVVCMKTTELTFLFFLFLSYEFFSKVRRDRMEETVTSIVNRRSNVVWMQSILLVFLNLLYCTIFVIYQIRMMKNNEINSRYYLIFILISVFLYHFLLYFEWKGFLSTKIQSSRVLSVGCCLVSFQSQADCHSPPNLLWKGMAVPDQ